MAQQALSVARYRGGEVIDRLNSQRRSPPMVVLKCLVVVMSAPILVPVPPTLQAAFTFQTLIFVSTERLKPIPCHPPHT